MSAAIFVASAAQLAAVGDQPPCGDRIKQAVAESALRVENGRQPDFAAAAEKLVTVAGG